MSSNAGNLEGGKDWPLADNQKVNWDAPSYNLKKLNSANNLNGLGSQSILRPSRKEQSSAIAMITAS